MGAFDTEVGSQRTIYEADAETVDDLFMHDTPALEVVQSLSVGFQGCVVEVHDLGQQLGIVVSRVEVEFVSHANDHNALIPGPPL